MTGMKGEKRMKKLGKAGSGLAGVLTVLFVILKLIGVINWSWLWVLSPLWITSLPTLLVLAIVFFGRKKS